MSIFTKGFVFSASCFQTTNQPIPNTGVWQAITFDLFGVGESSFYDSVQSRMVASVRGIYEFVTCVQFTGGTPGEVVVLGSGVNVPTFNTPDNAPISYTPLGVFSGTGPYVAPSIARLVQMNAGDFINVLVQYGGAANTLTTRGGFAVFTRPFASLKLLRAL